MKNLNYQLVHVEVLKGYKERITELERKLEESECKSNTDGNRLAYEKACEYVEYLETQLAERDALIREGIKHIEEFESGFVQIEGVVTASEKWLTKAKGVVGE